MEGLLNPMVLLCPLPRLPPLPHNHNRRPLHHLPSEKKGFATVPASLPALGTTWGLSLLWRSVPSLVFILFSAYRESITNAVAVRAPLVELCSTSSTPHSPAARTILLDYCTNSSLTVWFRASQRGHCLLGITLVFSLVFGALTALVASLLSVEPTPIADSDVTVLLNTTLQANHLNASVGWQSVIFFTSATMTYGASRLPGTDGYNIISSSGADGYDISADPRSEGGEVTMVANDRGCEVKQEFGVADLQTT
ncbi:hypothetical protein MKZ38_004606 [Zalerion maritima]|uniref:Uncharacterized protein n=1 Tax=Zalerion maritima TaxID=339359 RepID=A0AAD5RXB7_9PEZI|nr:hypothetical protein MKZ38_004606 [Zalerion maritima]